MIAHRWNIAQAFEFYWWKQYLLPKVPEQYLQWKKDYWENILEKTFGLLGDERIKETFRNKQLRILDAGCGPAGIFLNLGKHRVDALDPLADKYIGEFRLIEKKEFPNVNFISKPLESFSSQATYDFIFCMNCINHVDDINTCVRNLFHSLKPNGILVMTADAHRYKRVMHLFKAIPADILHPHQMNLKGYADLLEEAFGEADIKTGMVKEGTLFNHYLLAAEKGNHWNE